MSIYDGLKDAASVLKEAGKIEQYKQILDDMEKLIEIQKHVQDLEIENNNLKEKLKITETIRAEGNIYYTINKDGVKDGPFCTSCWDTKNNLVRLHTTPSSGRVHCPACNVTATHGHAQVVHIDHWKNSAI